MRFAETNFNQLYLSVLRHLVDHGTLSAPRRLPILEQPAASLRLEVSRQCVLCSLTRRLNYHFMVAEWWWIATGRNDVEMLAYYNSKVAQFSDDGLTFFGAYGPPWLRQVPYVLAKLREDRDSRQAVVDYWRESPPPTKDVPCTLTTQYLIRGDYLNAVVTMRSSDAWLGLPYDIFNQSQLQAQVAGELGLVPGFLQFNIGSLHLYKRDLERACEVLNELEGNGWVSPLLNPLPGLLLPLEFAHEWEASARQYGDVTTDHQPWREYLEVLAHRHPQGPLTSSLPHPWVVLLDAPLGRGR